MILVSPSMRDMVQYGMLGVEGFGVGGHVLLGLEALTFSVGGWRWWSKGIFEFRFGPNLGLRLEAWTKLNNKTKFCSVQLGKAMEFGLSFRPKFLFNQNFF